MNIYVIIGCKTLVCVFGFGFVFGFVFVFGCFVHTGIGSEDYKTFFEIVRNVAKAIVNYCHAHLKWEEPWSKRNKPKYYGELDAFLANEVDVGRFFYELYIKPKKKQS